MDGRATALLRVLRVDVTAWPVVPLPLRARDWTSGRLLEVDGEQFAVRLVVDPATGYTDTGYTCLSGPNKGYGFGAGGPPKPSLEAHRQRIREFLAMVDSTTGYIEDD